MPAQVDPLAGCCDPLEQRLDELRVPGDERVHGAVVIGVGVDVEQTCPPSERRADGFHDLGVASLRDVRDGFERELHALSLGRLLACSRP